MNSQWSRRGGEPPDEPDEPSLRNLNTLNRRAVISFFFVTDDNRMCIFPNASYEAQQIAELASPEAAPEEVRLEFTDNRGREMTLVLTAGSDKNAFGVILVKLAAGTLGMIRPGREDVASVNLETGWTD